MKFKPGDKVLIKSWDEMLEDGQVYCDFRGNLHEDKTNYTFTEKMWRFCGRSATVTEVNDKEEIKLFTDEFGRIGHTFRPWMLEENEIVSTTVIYTGRVD